MRYSLSLALVAALSSIPGYVRAQDMHILPDGALIECGGEAFYCYTFEGARELKLADVKCTEYDLTLSFLERKLSRKGRILEVSDSLINEQASLMLNLLESHENLLSAYRDLKKDFIQADSRDIWGGSIYILIGVSAASFGVGILLTLLLS